MGTLKSSFGDAADSISGAASKRRSTLQERYEQHKREVLERYEQHKREVLERYEQQKSEARSMRVGPEMEEAPKEEISQAKENASQSETDEQFMFSPRLEALIKSAFRDGVLTKKEKENIIKCAVAEGEDVDEFEILFNSRIADEGIKEE